MDYSIDINVSGLYYDNKQDFNKECILALPESLCGIYQIYDKNGNLVYIGKSNNIRSRLLSHYNTNINNKHFISFDFIYGVFEPSKRDILETHLINEHKPKFNIAKVWPEKWSYLKEKSSLINNKETIESDKFNNAWDNIINSGFRL